MEKATKKYLVVTADTNDADYVTNVAEITDEQIEKFKPVFEAIKNFKPYFGYYESGRKTSEHKYNFQTHNWNGEHGEKSAQELYEHLTGEESWDEFVYYFVPKNPDNINGIHTIKSIEVFEVVTKETFL